MSFENTLDQSLLSAIGMIEMPEAMKMDVLALSISACGIE